MRKKYLTAEINVTICADITKVDENQSKEILEAFIRDYAKTVSIQFTEEKRGHIIQIKRRP